MLLGKTMTFEQWRCFAVKNKCMKRIKNQFRTDQLQSTESTLYGDHCSWRIRTRLWSASGQGTQLVNVQQHVTQLHVGLACLKRRIFTVPRVTDLFVVNWSKSCSEYSLKISTVCLLLCNRVSACIGYVLQCSVFVCLCIRSSLNLNRPCIHLHTLHYSCVNTKSHNPLRILPLLSLKQWLPPQHPEKELRKP